MVSGLDRPLAGTHAVSTGTWLTGAAPKRTEAEDFIANTSLDQILANQIGRDSVFPSFEIATEDLTGSRCGLEGSAGRMASVRWAGAAELLASAVDGKHPVDARAVAIAAALPVRDLRDEIHQLRKLPQPDLRARRSRPTWD